MYFARHCCAIVFIAYFLFFFIFTSSIALTVRYLTRRYIGEYRSKTDLLYRQTISLDSSLLDVEIVDISMETDDDFPTEQIQWADSCLIVYSIIDRDSFNYAKKALGNLKSLQNGPSAYLIANKCDLDHLRTVSVLRRRFVGTAACDRPHFILIFRLHSFALHWPTWIFVVVVVVWYSWVEKVLVKIAISLFHTEKQKKNWKKKNKTEMKNDWNINFKTNEHFNVIISFTNCQPIIFPNIKKKKKEVKKEITFQFELRSFTRGLRPAAMPDPLCLWTYNSLNIFHAFTTIEKKKSHNCLSSPTSIGRLILLFLLWFSNFQFSMSKTKWYFEWFHWIWNIHEKINIERDCNRRTAKSYNLFFKSQHSAVGFDIPLVRNPYTIIMNCCFQSIN